MASKYDGVFDKAGGGDAPADDDYDKDEDQDEPGDEKLPPDFEAAYDDYEKNPTAMTFWRAVEACADHKGGGGGLAILLGGPKGKKGR